MASQANALKDFLEFVKSLWAILATTSVLFPFASKFRDLIPIEPINGDPSFPFYYFIPSIIPTLASLICAFIILLIFNQRDYFKDQARRPKLMKRSILSFVLGLLGLLMYLSLRNVDVGSFMPEIDPNQLINIKPIVKFMVDVVMLCCYCLFFGMITRTFMLQGIITYYGRFEC